LGVGVAVNGRHLSGLSTRRVLPTSFWIFTSFFKFDF
jgi:hypothetical protein